MHDYVDERERELEQLHHDMQLVLQQLQQAQLQHAEGGALAHELERLRLSECMLAQQVYIWVSFD